MASERSKRRDFLACIFITKTLFWSNKIFVCSIPSIIGSHLKGRLVFNTPVIKVFQVFNSTHDK